LGPLHVNSQRIDLTGDESSPWVFGALTQDDQERKTQRFDTACPRKLRHMSKHTTADRYSNPMTILTRTMRVTIPATMLPRFGRSEQRFYCLNLLKKYRQERDAGSIKD
jgi:hypothetical protein